MSLQRVLVVSIAINGRLIPLKAINSEGKDASALDLLKTAEDREETIKAQDSYRLPATALGTEFVVQSYGKV